MMLKKARIGATIAIAAGKGGVGKSTVTVNCAAALAASGAKVGIIDTDLYGPSIAKMMGEEGACSVDEDFIIPARKGNIYYVSLAHFPMGNTGAFVRAPLANQIITDFLTQVAWPDLDYLLLDFPPGTGDIQLTIMQSLQLTGAILVTTPQQVALLDVAKALKMFQSMQVPILGLIENMSCFHIGESKHFPFGESQGVEFAKQRNIALLGQIPIDPLITLCGDSGKMLLELDPKGVAAQSYMQISYALFAELVKVAKQGSCVSVDLVWNRELTT